MPLSFMSRHPHLGKLVAIIAATMTMMIRSIKIITLLLAALAVSGNAVSETQHDGFTASLSTSIHTSVSAAEEFIDFEAELLNRRLQVQETTRCNTWCMLKNSIGLTILGLIFVCLSPCLLWKNEGRHVKELRRIDFCRNKAVVIDNADIPIDDNTGNLVHFVGKVTVDDDTLDFNSGVNISTPLTKALFVKRTCSIYQKFEQSSTQTKNDMIGAGQTTTTTFTIKEEWTNKGPQGQLPHFPHDHNSRGIWDELVSASGTPETASQEPTNLPPQLAALLQQVDLSKAPHGISVSKACHVGGFQLSSEILMSEKV